MNMRVGGSLLYPVAPNVPNDELIYRPEYGGGGLLNSGRDFYKPGNVGSTFAGGSLLGQYYDASTNTFKPLQPSGVFTTNPDDAANIADDTRTGGGAFTLSELMGFEGALRQANFGDNDYQSVFSGFEDMGDGTYDIRPNGFFVDYLYGKDAEGKSVPMNLAVYGERHERAGELFDPEFRNRLIRARLSGIDLSGGQDGGDPGPDDGNDGNDGSGNAGGDAGESDAP
tara:strand:+ start:516 stop:1196 length:681 start_codon:yes stop_codon:yes gene_type:complete